MRRIASEETLGWALIVESRHRRVKVLFSPGGRRVRVTVTNLATEETTTARL